MDERGQKQNNRTGILSAAIFFKEWTSHEAGTAPCRAPRGNPERVHSGASCFKTEYWESSIP